MKPGTPKMAATFRLSSSTPSRTARSVRLSGFACTTFIRSAGMMSGALGSFRVRKLCVNASRLSGSLKSLSELPAIPNGGLYSLLMYAFFVAAVWAMLSTMSPSCTRVPTPCQG